MPFGMPSPEMDAKVERCVTDLTAKGREKVSAIKICKASVLKKEEAPNDEAIKIMELEGLEYDEAVLSTQTRKDLPATAFCGPDRSYPAHDLAHARNALARVAQFGTPALQSSVRACVLRKFPQLKDNGKEEELILQTSMNIKEDTIDEEKRTVEACVLSPCISGNKRYYSPAIVEKVAGQLSGLKSFADHDNRSAKNIIAKIVDAKLEDGKAIATFKFSKARDIAESIFTRVKEGIVSDVSIAASGVSKKVKINNEWIDEITDIKVKSVDFVSEGGVPDAKVLQVFESNSLPKIEEVKEIVFTDEELKAHLEKEGLTEQEVPDMKTCMAQMMGDGKDKDAALQACTLKLKTKKETINGNSDIEAIKKENEELKARIKEKEINDLKIKLISELKEDEKIKTLISKRVIGTTEEELKKSIEENLALIREVKETFAEVKGIPPIKIEGVNGKRYSSSKEILDDSDLTEDMKGELISKLWWGK